MAEETSASVALTRDLIRRPSVTPADAGALDILQKRLGAAGFTTSTRAAVTRPKSVLATSKEDFFSPRAISSMVARPSHRVMTTHSWGVRVIGPASRSEATRRGTASVEGIFRERIFHSSLRRAASIRRFVLEREMVCRSLSTPGENWKEPPVQRASA